MRIIYYPVPLVFVLLLLAACSQKQPKETPYIDRAEELFQSVWSKYRVPQYGLFAEYYPNTYKPDLTYFQDSTHKAQETSYLWPMSGIFSAVNLLAECDPQNMPLIRIQWLWLLKNIMITSVSLQDIRLIRFSLKGRSLL